MQDLTDLFGSNRTDWKTLLKQSIDFEQIHLTDLTALEQQTLVM